MSSARLGSAPLLIPPRGPQAGQRRRAPEPDRRSRAPAPPASPGAPSPPRRRAPPPALPIRDSSPACRTLAKTKSPCPVSRFTSRWPRHPGRPCGAVPGRGLHRGSIIDQTKYLIHMIVTNVKIDRITFAPCPGRHESAAIRGPAGAETGSGRGAGGELPVKGAAEHEAALGRVVGRGRAARTRRRREPGPRRSTALAALPQVGARVRSERGSSPRPDAAEWTRGPPGKAAGSAIGAAARPRRPLPGAAPTAAVLPAHGGAQGEGVHRPFVAAGRPGAACLEAEGRGGGEPPPHPGAKGAARALPHREGRVGRHHAGA